MQYMLLVYIDPEKSAAPGSPEMLQQRERWMRISEEMAPVTVAGAPLEAIDTATTVRTDANGDPVLTDGPFAETKEFLGGYYIIDVPDLDTAASWAARLPNQGQGSVEVRPVQGFPGLSTSPSEAQGAASA
jgi:hypothetical protein